jgi:predicted dehydrogenase
VANELKIGLIGLDTSHVVAFTRLLNRADDPHHILGARVVAGWPGGSRDFELSWSRVENFTAQLRDEFGVRILDTPEAVAENADLVFIESVDGRVHRELLERTLRYHRPTFIDKPLATSLDDARAILRMAREAGVPVMSCSPLRYADTFQSALDASEAGPILGCDAMGPMPIEPTQPGLFWYGVHMVELLIAALGPDCIRVRAHTNADHDVFVAEWLNGRMASIHGVRGGHDRFGIVLHRQHAMQFVDLKSAARPYYASLLEVILRSLPHGRSDVPEDQMLAVMRLIAAANTSRETGETVDVQMNA